jgi:hypothetical protein
MYSDEEQEYWAEPDTLKHFFAPQIMTSETIPLTSKYV